ncbi:MAG: amino acid transport protein [Candidatus Omnitrophica bacterium]|nr:amino acid transport protein [Candidatus Omnitrophota bacterium]
MAGIGLLQAADFSAAKIFAYIIFGAIGFVAFMYGKKNKFFQPVIIGIALMVYPYFISGTFFLYLVGVALTVALYFWRE